MTRGLLVNTSPRIVVVDAADFDAVRRYRWSSSGRHVQACIGGRSVTMHRFLMDPPHGYVVDHVNANGFDNRRANLRICTPTQNAQNRNAGGYLCFSPNGYKGVQYASASGYSAHICSTYLGLYKTQEEAAMAYDAAARARFGEFARLNFPREGEQSAFSCGISYPDDLFELWPELESAGAAA